MLDSKKYFYIKSIAKAAYIIYKKEQYVSITVDSKTGYRWFTFINNDENKKLSEEYVKKINNDGKVMVNMVRYNHIVKYLKDLKAVKAL